MYLFIACFGFVLFETGSGWPRTHHIEQKASISHVLRLLPRITPSRPALAL